MPKGIPNPKPAAGASRRLVLQLNEDDYLALEKLAAESYRTPELQAAYLVARVLGDAGRTNSVPAAAERILERAQQRAANGS